MVLRSLVVIGLLLGCKGEHAPADAGLLPPGTTTNGGTWTYRPRPRGLPCVVRGGLASPTLAQQLRGDVPEEPAILPPGVTGAALDGDAAYFLDAVGHAVVRQPKAGGAAERMSDWDDDHGALRVGPGDLLVVTPAQLQRVPKPAGPLEVLGKGDQLMDAALDGERVYELRARRLTARSLADGARTVLSEQLDQAMRLALVGDHVYIATVGALQRIARDASGVAPEPVADLRGAVGYAVHATAEHVYYTQVGTGASVERVPRAGGPPETVASLGGAPVDVAIDEHAVYVVMDVDDPARPRRALWRCDLATGEVTQLVDGLSGWTTVVVDDTHLAWTSGDAGYLARKDDVAHPVVVRAPPRVAAPIAEPDGPYLVATPGHRSGATFDEACAHAPPLGDDPSCRADFADDDELDPVAPYQRVLLGSRAGGTTYETSLAIAVGDRWHLVSLGTVDLAGPSWGEQQRIRVASIAIDDVVPGDAPEIVVRGTWSNLADERYGLTAQMLWVCGIGPSARPSCVGAAVGYAYTAAPDAGVRSWKVKLRHRFDARGRLVRELVGRWPDAASETIEREELVGTVALVFP